MLDALPLPVWRCDDADRLLDSNRAYARAFATSRETVLAENAALAAKGEPNAAGDTSLIEANVGMPVDEQRELLDANKVSCCDGGTIGFALDHTDAENARGELKRHIDAYTSVLEIVPAAVAIFGPDKRLQIFNSAFVELWALDAAWLASKPRLGEILERLHESRCFPEFRDFRAFKREHCAMFSSLTDVQRELMHLPDGRTLQLTISPHPFGGLIFVYGDVTDRLALECSYNTLAQVQRATLDHLYEGIAVYGGDGRLKLHNPAFCALWGLSEEDVAGEPHIAEIVDKARGFIDHRGKWDVIKEELVAQVTAQILTSGPVYRSDGSMLQVASVPLPDGEVLLTYLDVTDAHRVERALRERNEALETAARLKNEFVANVSHELRVPLNTIIGFAEILHNQYFGSLNASQREYSRGILDSAHQLTTLINDILDLATLEAGYGELVCSPVGIHEMLQGVMTLASERARSRGLDVILRCPPSIGAIDGDEQRLKQALFNLVSDAIRFTSPGGAITVSAERRNDQLLLSVGDSGVGIAAFDRARPFGKFERCPRQPGTGLGLSLVKSVIELHGGAVDIEAIGYGTRVICSLPANGLHVDSGAALATTATAVCRRADSPIKTTASMV